MRVAKCPVCEEVFGELHALCEHLVSSMDGLPRCNSTLEWRTCWCGYGLMSAWARPGEMSARDLLVHLSDCGVSAEQHYLDAMMGVRE